MDSLRFLLLETLRFHLFNVNAQLWSVQRLKIRLSCNVYTIFSDRYNAPGFLVCAYRPAI